MAIVKFLNKYRKKSSTIRYLKLSVSIKFNVQISHIKLSILNEFKCTKASEWSVKKNIAVVKFKMSCYDFTICFPSYFVKFCFSLKKI